VLEMLYVLQEEVKEKYDGAEIENLTPIDDARLDKLFS